MERIKSNNYIINILHKELKNNAKYGIKNENKIKIMDVKKHPEDFKKLIEINNNLFLKNRTIVERINKLDEENFILMNEMENEK